MFLPPMQRMRDLHYDYSGDGFSIAELEDKLNNQIRIKVTDEDFNAILRDPLSEGESQAWYSGTSQCITVQQGGEFIRYVHEDVYPYPRTALAAPYLSAMLNLYNIKHIRRMRRDLEMMKKCNPPSFWRGETVVGEDISHVDCQAAYFSIMKNVTYDTFFSPDGYIALGTMEWQDLPTLAKDKLLRNAIPTCAANKGMTRYLKDRGWFQEDRIVSKLTSPGLWILIQTILTRLAAIAWDYGALSWTVDGGYFPTHKVQPYLERIQEECDWLLVQVDARDENGVVLSPQHFRVGNKVSKIHPEDRAFVPRNTHYESYINLWEPALVAM